MPQTRLIQHYVDNFRRLPWRSPPGAPPPDPYRVWLSEVMLQQTTVATVAPRFERFVARWPTIDALAAASDADILSEWAGLGYYARARNLIACAREIAARGGFPADRGGVARAARDRRLHLRRDRRDCVRRKGGGGRHQCRAGHRPAPWPRAARAASEVERLVLAMMPADRPGDFVQAMMDLGATVCRPSKPRCGDCPLKPDCVAFASGAPERFPAPRVRRERPHRHGIAWWIERDGALWLVRRPATGLLGGMAALPGSDWTDAPQPAPRQLGSIRHVFTHFSLDLAVAAALRHDRRGLVAAARPARRSRVADALSPRGGTCAAGCGGVRAAA